METKPNEPINPCLYQRVGEGDEGLRPNKPNDPKEWNIAMGGLTKREYFAAIAMQGLLASCDWNRDIAGEIHASDTAEFAVKYADALIQSLNKTD